LKVRECFLQAVSIVRADDDAREAWVSMNRKNAPWVAVRGENGRLKGLLRGEEIASRVQAPETFLTAGELVADGDSAKRAINISPDAELNEAVLQMEMAGADASFVQSPGRPPGVLELSRAKSLLLPSK
jgi:hypothetical protein